LSLAQTTLLRKSCANPPLQRGDLPAILQPELATALPLASWQRMFHAPILPHHPNSCYRTLEGLEGLEGGLYT
jgi:hypothetical protein